MNEANKTTEVNQGYVETKTTCLLLPLVWWANRRGVKNKNYSSQFDPIFFSTAGIINNMQAQNLSCKQHNKIVELKKTLLGWMLGLTVLTCALSPNAATSSPAPTVLPILSPGGAYAATGLVANVRRSETQPRKAIARVSWRVANQAGSQQRIDITMYWDGFARGNFETVGPLSPGQSFVELNELEAGINYYWRVLTLTPKGWVPSETARCAVSVYPVDEPRGR